MRVITTIIMCFIIFNIGAQDWDGIPVPPNPGNGNVWKLQEAPSDDFNYNFNETNQFSNFGNNKWYNFYHNNWDGPGTTYWQYNHVSVDGSDLVIRASRNPSTVKLGVPGINAGCITSNNRVRFPVFVEASISFADIVLASDVWLLSPDDTQEIDIIECYGGDEQGNDFFAEFIHLSHHSFVRQPFTDYQPRDRNSWWSRKDVDSWGEYAWNNGNRRYTRVGVNWISPFHFEYYIDGQIVRVLYKNAFATRDEDGNWSYTYPTMTNGELDTDNSGFQRAVQHATSATYSFQTLQAASNVSSVSVIDPFNYQGGNGYTKELDIIVNVESQDWHVVAGRTPTNQQLSDPARNKMKIDWIRVYKPIDVINADDRERSISFDNRSEYVPTGETDPVVDFNQVIPLSISYKTAITSGVEEDLFYIGVLTRQLDSDGLEVGSSEFVTIVPDEGLNQSTAEFSYTIPTDFANGNPIPATSKLPDGHKLVLVLFMSINNDSIFVDATDTIIINDNNLSVSTFNAKKNISIYPNPTNDYINVKGEFNSWKIYSILGKKLGEGKEKKINMSNLSTGVYYISFDDKKEIARFIKN